MYGGEGGACEATLHILITFMAAERLSRNMRVYNFHTHSFKISFNGIALYNVTVLYNFQISYYFLQLQQTEWYFLFTTSFLLIYLQIALKM